MWIKSKGEAHAAPPGRVVSAGMHPLRCTLTYFLTLPPGGSVAAGRLKTQKEPVTATKGLHAIALGRVSGDSFPDQRLDLGVEVFRAEEERRAEAGEGELEGFGGVDPGDFDAESGGGAAVAGEVETGGVGLLDEGWLLAGVMPEKIWGGVDGTDFSSKE